MNAKGHMAVGMLMSIPFIIIMWFIMGWFKIDSIVTLIQLLAVLLMSPLVMDLDHEQGTLLQIFTGAGLTLAVIGIVLMKYDIPTWEALVTIGVALSAITFYNAQFSHHRGFWHSIPACVLYGAAVFYLGGVQLAFLAFVGAYSHLLADKIPFKIH